MGLLNAAIDLVTGGPSISAETDPNDERWWLTGPHYTTQTGITVTPRMALGVSCIFQGVRLISETLAGLPLRALRDRVDGGRDPVTDHLVPRLLHATRGTPNVWQTGMQLRETIVAHALLWGTGYARIRFGAGPAGVTLIPLDPDTVEVEQLGDYRLRYRVSPQPDALPGSPESQFQTLVHEEVFRVQGIAVHRFMPPSLLALARETVGQWLATQQYNSLFYAHGGSSPRIYFEHPARPGEDAITRIRETFVKWMSGSGKAHKPIVGEGGMKPHMIGYSPRDAQYVEGWPVIIGECARWLNVPVQLLMLVDEPTHASADIFAQQFRELTLLPVARRVEGAITRDLIAEDDIVAEHAMEGLLRAAFKERLEGYAIGLSNAIWSQNEVRKFEGLNPVEGGDEPSRAANIGGSQTASARRLRNIARGAAENVVTKEVRAATSAAKRTADDPAAWAEWCREWYAAHVSHVSEVMEIEPGLAREYCEARRERLVTEGAEALAMIESEGAGELLALALEEDDA